MAQNNPYPDSQEVPEENPGVYEKQQQSQDQSKVPAYPYLMQGQQGWPTMPKQAVETYSTQPQPAGGAKGDWNQNGGINPGGMYSGGDVKPWSESGMYENQPVPSAPAAPSGMSREQYRDAWMSSGAKTMDQLNQFVAQNGGKVVSGNGTVLTPSGEYIDMLTGARSGGNGSAGWTGINGGAGDPRNAGQTGTGAAFGGGSAGGGGIWDSGSGGGASGGWGDKANGLYGMLMQRAQQGLNINSKDPIIANQVNSFRAEQTRGLRDQLAQQAEAGGPNDNMNMERRMGNEKAAQATGSLQASLMQNELGARRQEIQQALSQMGSMLSDQQRMDLQRQLGLIDAGIRQQQVNNQNSQFLDSFGLQTTDRANYWDALRSGLING